MVLGNKILYRQIVYLQVRVGVAALEGTFLQELSDFVVDDDSRDAEDLGNLTSCHYSSEPWAALNNHM